MANRQHLGINIDRKKLLCLRYRRSLQRLVKKNRTKSTLELTEMFCTGHRGISTCTNRRELKRMEQNNCASTRKPLLSAINRRKILEFAKKRQDLTVKQWGNFRWTDEARFSLFQNNGHTRVQRELHEALDPS
ncbi:hypothetical protein AVEN_219221-1 [Araneus ventricosus]|uniref:Transposase Tc1-like domain-containing protein n=1 Tax=Araneus ventricosus TaxID=182803 RepID=A0A4Y2R6Z3_ARAVE|nr:hypothetical protein AVEN_219221-1 [Araneus ventricosus]